MSLLLAFCFYLPFLSCLTLGAAAALGWQRYREIGFAFSWLYLILAGLVLWAVSDQGTLVYVFGDWPVPAGIAYAADPLAATFVALVAISSVLCHWIGPFEDKDQNRVGLWVLLHGMHAGLNSAFLTGDFFNLFVAFEVFLILSYGLVLALHPVAKARNSYFYLNVMASTLLLVAQGVLYTTVGSLNMTEVAARVASDSDPTRLAYLLVFSLFLIVALLKAGAAPFFQWMPDTYAGLPAGLAAFFSALLTKVGIYVALRIGVTVFPLQAQVLAPAVQWIAVASVFIGVFAALGQSDLKRLLAFHSVSQIGLILFGVGLAYEGREGLVELAVASVVLFVLHHSAVKSSLFAMSAAYERVGGSSSLNAVRGWTSRAPWFALLFLVAAFSLAGLPPSSGFMAKWKLMMGVALEGRLVVLAILVASGLLTLASMLKIWKLSLSGPSNLPRTEASQATLRSLVVPLFVFVAMSVGMIVFYRPLLDWVDRVGYELANPANYLKAVVDQGTQQWQLREQGR